jgi:ComF family protein
MSFHTISYFFREYFFPAGCGACAEALFKPTDAYYGLCEKCRAFISAALYAEKRCGICGKPLITERENCLSCRQSTSADKGSYNRHLEKIYCLFPYSGKFKKILSAYKFSKSLGLGNYLAGCLSISLDTFLPENATPVWVPVPPRPEKQKEHGWDQIEFIARQLEKESFLPLSRCLKRLPSKSQKALNRKEREVNLLGRIICVKQPPKTAILFDDVITTGVTLDACAAALLKGGAEKVYGICLFYD